jgi:predicted AAA+ superfamily ATPase
MWLKRVITPKIEATLARGKSILLLGPRQTGKTTLVKKLKHDLYITLMHPAALQKYESTPALLNAEIQAQNKLLGRKPLVIIDEIQKIPNLTDAIQVMIDEGVAQFVVTGSSARKIKNLLPGRVIKYELTPLSLLEMDDEISDLEEFLVNGSLPEVYTTKIQSEIEELLSSYVNLYIEEEIRKEALVRNIAGFTNFLKLACIESGNIVNLRKISTDIGVSHQTIGEYYRILEDCMLVERIDALSISTTRKRLTKSAKYIIFDTGVRRLGAHESVNPAIKQQAFLFEQFIGLEIIRLMQQIGVQGKLMFWRSHDGPEVDYVIDGNGLYVPIEVKWTDKPNHSDIKHLLTFRREYKVKKFGYVICRCSAPMLLAEDIFAMPWQELPNIIKDFNQA